MYHSNGRTYGFRSAAIVDGRDVVLGSHVYPSEGSCRDGIYTEAVAWAWGHGYTIEALYGGGYISRDGKRVGHYFVQAVEV